MYKSGTLRGLLFDYFLHNLALAGAFMTRRVISASLKAGLDLHLDGTASAGRHSVKILASNYFWRNKHSSWLYPSISAETNDRSKLRGWKLERQE